MVLIFALIFILLIGLVAGSAMQTSIQEIRMAGNDQLREAAFQKAQALVSAIVDNPDNFPLDGPVDQLICDRVDATPDCDPDVTVVLPDRVISLSEDMLPHYGVQRQPPLLRDALAIRSVQKFSSSVVAYDVAVFEAYAVVAGPSARSSRSELVQGVAVLLAKSQQGRWSRSR
jgi:PilX N-terminal